MNRSSNLETNSNSQPSDSKVFLNMFFSHRRSQQFRKQNTIEKKSSQFRLVDVLLLKFLGGDELQAWWNVFKSSGDTPMGWG